MLEKLYSIGCLNLEKLILKYSKKLGLDSDETIILIKLIEILKSNKKVKESVVAKETGLDETKVANTIAKFIELALIEFKIEIVNGIGDEGYSISPLFVSLEKAISSEEEKKSSSDKIINFLENKLLRTLSAREMENVLSWNDQNVTLDQVKASCKNIEENGLNLTVIRIEKGLYSLNEPKKTVKKNHSKIEELLNQ